MMDKYGYIGIETLLDFCENSTDHAVTPNDFMRMKRVKEPEILRCLECQYAIHNQGKPWICGHPENNAWRIADDFYCGRAERKTE